MGSVSLVNGHVDDDMPRYTEQEIIESLEEMSAEHPGNFSCDVLDLINRKNAEIERLKNKVEKLSEVLSDTIRIRYAEAKVEAFKEFAERLQDRCNKQGGCLYASDIGAELNEMVGE